ncbi:arylamine N-acetyltransferase family protein [Hyphococcus sp.]|jgi:N-hydroxyarylamine O-acetyltransferase|uniref:arylamine N-acetyltransferase family protein n=1 Tax=Hyphococcus sp. TaxID=2038636 RepID=UPI003D0B1E14
MNLSAYFDRIGYDGPVRPDASVLKAVHRAHVEAIPYENLDVQFGAPVTRAPAAAFDKIVTRRRGGWCYEMNGLLGWALEEIGFKVERLAGAVARNERGDGSIGNHLVLIVDLDEPWLADAGFGDGLIEAIPLRMGAFQNGPFHCRLEDIGGGWVRYHNDPRGGGPAFDFNRSVTDENLLEKLCGFLQTSEDSPFVQNAVTQRWLPDRHICLRGRVFTALSNDNKIVDVLTDAEHYLSALRERFGLDLPPAAGLWPKICARHEEVFAAKAVS